MWQEGLGCLMMAGPGGQGHHGGVSQGGNLWSFEMGAKEERTAE